MHRVKFNPTSVFHATRDICKISSRQAGFRLKIEHGGMAVNNMSMYLSEGV